MVAIRLIHPIHLDVPMLVSFSAAIQGGLLLGAEITKETGTTKSKVGDVGGRFGLSNLLGSLFNASIEGMVTGQKEERGQDILKESRQHTEASIAILLYAHLLKVE